MNCIVVDVGNTFAKIALAQGGRISRQRRLRRDEETPRGIERAIREVAARHAVEGAVLCSVVPRVSARWSTGLRAVLGSPPLMVTHKTRLGVGIDYPRPETIGADRLANACGAYARHGAPVIVADFGTAVTFDVVSREAMYVGGVIAPGLSVMTDYLAEKTALLPRLRLRGSFGRVGRSTVTAMRIGAKVGYRGLVREITEYLVEGLKGRRVALCATGGFAQWVLKDLDMPFRIEPDLTLFGLSRIFALNCARTKVREQHD